MSKLSQLSQDVCTIAASKVLQVPQVSQKATQEIDELLYEATNLAGQLPMTLSPLVRESLKANLVMLVQALQLRGVDVVEYSQQEA